MTTAIVRANKSSMARLRKGSVPSYRLHKARNLAVVTIYGKNQYLGQWDTPASKQKYAALIRNWQERQSNHNCHDRSLDPGDRPTINELILAYLKHVAVYYKANHGENKEAGCVDDALKVVQSCGYGNEPADSFRPKDLKRVRDAMIAKNWSRTYVNSQINRIKRMFRHAVEEDFVAGTIYHALTAVRGLRKGGPGVRETKRVKPVPVGHIKPTLKKSHRVLKAMILFGYYTGARPGEVCALKPRYLDRTGKVWVFIVPGDANKTEHHDQERRIYVGPRAQRILSPWLENIPADDFVFSPRRAEEIRQAQRRASRKTPLWPSHQKCLTRKRSLSPCRPKREYYDPASFRRAVKRACQLAAVPAWSPNQLRHNAGTRFRKRHGLEVARVLLGHRKMNTSEIYAEADAGKAKRAALNVG